MSESMLASSFNTCVCELIDTLRTRFPDVPEFKKVKHGFSLLLSVTDAAYPSKMFDAALDDMPGCREAVMSQDDAYFLDRVTALQVSGPTQSAQTVFRGLGIFGGGQDNIFKDFVDTMKQRWAGLSPDERTTIWKYLVAVVMLNEKMKAVR